MFSVTLTHERLWFYLQQLLKLKTCVRLVVSHLLCMVSTRSSDINTLEGGVELFASPTGLRLLETCYPITHSFFLVSGVSPMSFHLITLCF